MSLLKRKRFCATNRMEITAMAGQKILGSGRDSICSIGPLGEVVKIGNTINAKAHAAIVTAPHVSIIGVDILDRPTVQNLSKVDAKAPHGGEDLAGKIARLTGQVHPLLMVS